VLWASDDSAGDSTSALVGLVNYGVLGTLVVLAAIGIVYFKPSVTDLRNQIADQRKDFAAQIESIRKDYTEQIAALRKDHTEQVTAMRLERDKAFEQRDAMAETLQKEWIPALLKALASVEALRSVMERMIHRPGGEQ
jgi:Skp family chaperone for outer membrane proteins